jgi:hypothetical protein
MTDEGLAVRRGDVLHISWRAFNESDARHPDYAFSVSRAADAETPGLRIQPGHAACG